MTRPKKPKAEKLTTKTNAELAAFYKVSISTIKSWQRKGYPVRDPEALQRKLDEQRTSAEITPSTPLAKARLRKLEAETEKIRFELAQQRGEFVAVAEVVAQAIGCAEVVRGEFMALRSEAPTWAGLSPAEIQDKATNFVNAALARMHERRDKL